MRVRSFLILSAATLAVCAATVMAVMSGERPQSTLEAVGPVLPGLADRLADVSSVVVRDGEQTLTIRRAEAGWALPEYGDYPVSTDKVREIVRGLVLLEKAEAKTANAGKWSRLSVEDVETPAATSKLVILRNGAGEVITQLIIGKSGTGVGAEGATYVRVPGETPAWLARGTVSASARPGDWVERRLLAIPVSEVQQVRIAHPDKATVTVVREGDGPSYRLAELPAGGKAKLKRPDALDDLVQAFADVSLEDLAPAAGRSFPAASTIRVSITRTDGSSVVFDLTEEQGERWLRFVEGKAPAGMPPAATAMAFRVPTWKFTPLERKMGELVEAPGG